MDLKRLQQQIGRRKSMRKFDNTLHVSEKELEQTLEKLKDVKTPTGAKLAFEIVKREETTAKWGEYCLLIYSENTPEGYLAAGFAGEAADLWFCENNIGACWYGMAKTDRKEKDALPYQMMIAFGKSKESDFRKSKAEFKRKNPEDLWQGERYRSLLQESLLAPSACNSQPWRIVEEEDGLRVFRALKLRTIIPHALREFYGCIDTGIFLCCLESCLQKENIPFSRTVETQKEPEGNKAPLLRYKLKA